MTETNTTPRRRGRRRPLIIGLVVVLSALVAAGGLLAVYALSINKTLSGNIHHGATLPPESSRPTDPEPTSKSANKPVNFVLMGSDSRDPGNEGAGRSDTLMVLHLTADRRHAYIISFPRDMWVDIAGHGKAKINAAYAYGGTALTVQTLESMLGVRMNHLAVIDFEGFIKLTDDLGGVTIDNEHAFTSNGTHFPKGKITVSGEKALWFVRERHQLPAGDFDRAKNQRKVVKAILDKALSASVIADPARFNAFIGGFARSVTVDDGLTGNEIRALAMSIRMKGSGLVTLQAPVSGTGTSSDGQSIDIVDVPKLKELSQALRDDDMAGYVKKYPGD